MSWLDHHSKSEELASQAEHERINGSAEQAIVLYRRAAAEELSALKFVDQNKARTYGITAVSAASLWYKAQEPKMAERIAHDSLSSGILPAFAAHQLKQILQTIWSEESRANSGVQFTKGEVLVSVSGGEVVEGGAPLDMILQKVKEVRGLFFRTIELLLHIPLRRKGEPSLEIQEQCRPWLFQAPPGSYQFAVRIEKPAQMEMFPVGVPEIEEVTQKFMEIVRASTEESGEKLKQIVPDEQYRSAFLKMTRNLAPTGKAFGKMEIKVADELMIPPVVLIPESRQVINEIIKPSKRPDEKEGPKTDQIRGILRNLHLDLDWLEVASLEGQKETIRVYETGEIIDDIVGPMVNRRVVVDVYVKGSRHIFRDIQLDD
jgi:hypothetical protein